MKRIVSKLSIIILLVLASTQVNARTNPFDKFASSDDVTYIYISELMLKLISADKLPEVNGVQLKAITEKLNGIQIITSAKNKKEKFLSEAMDIAKKEKYEPLLQIAEEKNKVNIYHGEGKEKSMIVMITEKEETAVVIVLSGTFNAPDIKKMLSKQ